MPHKLAASQPGLGQRLADSCPVWPSYPLISPPRQEHQVAQTRPGQQARCWWREGQKQGLPSTSGVADRACHPSRPAHASWGLPAALAGDPGTSWHPEGGIFHSATQLGAAPGGVGSGLPGGACLGNAASPIRLHFPHPGQGGERRGHTDGVMGKAPRPSARPPRLPVCPPRLESELPSGLRAPWLQTRLLQRALFSAPSEGRGPQRGIWNPFGWHWGGGCHLPHSPISGLGGGGAERGGDVTL